MFMHYFLTTIHRMWRDIILAPLFLGHGNFETCLKKLTSMKGLDYNHHLIQLSMDGPIVNWKLLELLQEHCIKNDLLAPDLLSIISCRLHVLHGTFNNGQNSTGW